MVVKYLKTSWTGNKFIDKRRITRYIFSTEFTFRHYRLGAKEQTTIKTIPILSHFQATPLIAAHKKGIHSIQTSIDLGVSSIETTVNEHGVILPDTMISWETIRRISATPDHCFYLEDGDFQPIRGFSRSTGRSLSLMPTEEAPALVIAGFPMHRIKGITPRGAVQNMVKTITPCHGRILDTATGLGYAAIELAKTATEVVTIEIEPEVERIARLNPWSSPLFSNPRIRRISGSSTEEVLRFPDASFAAIFHDPPTVTLAGELYGGEFYGQLLRLLSPRGRLFHYIADPRSPTGMRTTKGVVKRLSDTGFTKVIAMPREFGVVACK